MRQTILLSSLLLLSSKVLAKGASSGSSGMTMTMTASGAAATDSTASVLDTAAAVTSASSGKNAKSSAASGSDSAATGTAVASGSGAMHTITVGGTGVLEFTPNNITANVGDMIMFDFLAKNHTVTQSTLADPCVAMAGGVDSGFMPNVANVAGTVMFNYTVTSTSPVWMFCKQTGHCEMGMVFAVNPGAKMDTFIAAAMSGSSNSSSATAAASGGTATSKAAKASGASVADASGTDTASATATKAAKGSASATATDSSATDASSAAGTKAAKATASASASAGTATKGSKASGSGSASAGGATFTVTVGGPNLLTYQPNNITAVAGDTIMFDFLEKNHTLTQSTLANPCSPMAGGIDSGFKPNPSNVANSEMFTLTVSNSTPMWFFCAQTGHCEKGMVFAVNPGTKMAQFMAAAMNSNGTTSNTTTPAVPFTGAGAKASVTGWWTAAMAGVVVLALGAL
ncbi:hypothetical protein RUND412_000790 [Rhizina undulata]